MSTGLEFTLLEESQIGIWSHGIGERVVVPPSRPATVKDLRLTCEVLRTARAMRGGGPEAGRPFPIHVHFV